MSVIHFILSSVCIGIANTAIEWLFIGFLFHKYQALTPQTWRTENSASYAYSTLLSLLFGIIFTFFYWKIGSRYVMSGDIWSACKFGLICFACFTFISELGNAIYINYDKKFLAGKLIATCLSYVVEAVIAEHFYSA
ncbi:MAG TPA: hypothetical protein VK711_00050 [Puia sp.]|nr:hypothetical protein [Puia sp.]